MNYCPSLKSGGLLGCRTTSVYLCHGVDQAESTLAPATVNAHHTHLQGQCTVLSHEREKKKLGFVGLKLGLVELYLSLD